MKVARTGPGRALFGRKGGGKTAGTLNKGETRIGISRHDGTDYFSVRIGDKHIDLYP